MSINFEASKYKSICSICFYRKIAVWVAHTWHMIWNASFDNLVYLNFTLLMRNIKKRINIINLRIQHCENWIMPITTLIAVSFWDTYQIRIFSILSDLNFSLLLILSPSSNKYILVISTFRLNSMSLILN